LGVLEEKWVDFIVIFMEERGSKIADCVKRTPSAVSYLQVEGEKANII